MAFYRYKSAVTDNLEEAYKQAYINYTTPLYLFLKKDGQEKGDVEEDRR